MSPNAIDPDDDEFDPWRDDLEPFARPGPVLLLVAGILVAGWAAPAVVGWFWTFVRCVVPGAGTGQ